MMAVRERYSHARADEHKRKKRKEAKERIESHAGRKDEQQLAKLDIEGHKATKERARLQDRIVVRKRVTKKG